MIRQRARRVGAVVVAMIAIWFATGSGVALAHDELVGSVPADGQAVDAAPAEVVLEFAAELQTLAGSTPVAVTRPDGTLVELPPAVVDGAFVRQPLPELDDGEYRVAYRVVSGDGHVITGGTRFFVGGVPSAEPVATTSAPPPAPARATTGATTAAAVAAADDDRGPFAVTVGLGVAGVVLVVGGAAALLVRRGGGAAVGRARAEGA